MYRTITFALLLCALPTLAGPPTLTNGYTGPATLKAVTSVGSATLTWSDARQGWTGQCAIPGSTELLKLAVVVLETTQGRVITLRYGGNNTDGSAPSAACPDFSPFTLRFVVEPSGFDGFRTYRSKITGTITE